MPVTVRKRRKGESGKAYKIVESSGRVVGQSDTLRDAKASARIRNARSKKR